MARFGNPFSFTPVPVTFFTVLIYGGLFAALLLNHYLLPPLPKHEPKGTNITEAWHDLQRLASDFHPYNSHANDQTRQFLLDRIYAILERNNVDYDTERDLTTSVFAARSVPVVVIDDRNSNVTSSNGKLSVYFEGSNIIISIDGSRGGCYQSPSAHSPEDKSISTSGVLVNAHFDSVSTGYGATDDGVGVVTILQLLSYFTTKGRKPENCVVLLLNNGEEDYLNGARAFLRHPVSTSVRTFLNLEGAGAGGRATLFRSTDTEVTRFYKNARYPFGTVVTGDGFKRGFVRSQTDYVVFNGDLGLRGLDVAFFEPRAKYHTWQDSTVETSKQSVWHMLSAAITTVEGLSSDTSDTFSGDLQKDGTVDAGAGTEAVWFDLFGQVFAVFRLHTLFALSVTLLVFTPVLFIALTVILSKADKMYLFARKGYLHSSEDDHHVAFNGWRGFFRYPITFVFATAALVALAYLYTKVNPHIIYSSEYAVWSSMLTAWFFIAWLGLRGSAATRPSALQRMYTLIWIYIGAFVLLTLVTISENNYHLAGGYFVVIYFAAVSLALLLSYLEMFGLPKKSSYVATALPPSSPESRPLTSNETPESRDQPRSTQDEDATETTSLLRNDRQSFARYSGNRRHPREIDSISSDAHYDYGFGVPFEKEQGWSPKLPSSLWLIQFLLIAPINIILIGQIALGLTAGLHQTGADGNDILTIYLFVAVLAVLLLIPIAPFLHRFHFHIPTFLFLIFIGTLTYNLVAFPFSSNNRLKLFFLQRVDCDTGDSTISLTGVENFVQLAASDLPSTWGQFLNCSSSAAYLGGREGLTSCRWLGSLPHPAPAPPSNSTTIYSRKKDWGTWFDFKAEIEKPGDGSDFAARFVVRSRNTRNCRLHFSTLLNSLEVEGGGTDKRYAPVGENGTTELRLWSRTSDGHWNVTVGWNDVRSAGEAMHESEMMTADGLLAEAKDKGEKASSRLTGSVVCLWADANEQGAIPALEEVNHFLPSWAIVTKASDGLVEGWKKFDLR